jgi:integrase
VGRKRKNNDLQLPKNVYARRGVFFFVHPDGRWENLGRDLAAARKRAEHYQDPTGTYGTMRWFLDQFIIDCEQRVAVKDLSKRTLDDYTDAVKYLKVYFGDMLPTEVKPEDVQNYLDDGVKIKRVVRANRERACLSACMSWMLRKGHGSIVVNPCMRASGVQRNTETERDRYVTNEEYAAVFKEAGRAARLMMELVYRTLQRPEVDVLAWTSSNIVPKSGEPVLRFRQSKTHRQIDIALEGRFKEIVQHAVGEVPVLHQPIVHTLKGTAYTYGGISTLLKDAIAVANERRKARKLAPIPSFGYRDLKGKGATDMWLSGVPIERIQLLCGHKQKSTTEKYIKARWSETAMPNTLEIPGVQNTVIRLANT